jgi:hypothetical protein
VADAEGRDVMSNPNIDPDQIDWNRMSALIVRRINVVQWAWRRSKTEFSDDQYRIAYFEIFLPLLAILLTFLEGYEKFIEERALDRMN